MEVIRKSLTLNKAEYYQAHLTIINCVLPVKMTPKEIVVLAAFMGLEGDIATPEFRFSSVGRKMVMKQANLSPAGLTNFLDSLEEKQFIKRSEDKSIHILPLLFPEDSEQQYHFRIVKN